MNTNRPCSELKIENNHANTMVLLLTESRPNTQVSPSNGRRIMVALKSCLHAYTSIGINMLLNSRNESGQTHENNCKDLFSPVCCMVDFLRL